MKHTLGLLWFTDDLRLSDNSLLSRAASECDNLILCYFVDPKDLKQDMYGCQRIGLHRRQFLAESLLALKEQLEALGQRLSLFMANPVTSIEAICSHLPVTHLYRSKPVAFNESRDWLRLRSTLPDVKAIESETRCLFTNKQVDYSPEDFPRTFSQFRKKAERMSLEPPLESFLALPEAASLTAFQFPRFEPETWLVRESCIAHGGEHAAHEHLEGYFSGEAPNHYKQTRNAFDGWEKSSKWSLWLANGNLSARQAAHALKEYQAEHGENEDNAWLMFELLWREYFQWYARAFNKRLFLLDGLYAELNSETKAKKRRGSFYAQRFRQWCMGTTPYPIVNACMRQLNETGYMSNRGRQIVASALINELGLDWRCGAAYFEQQLIDYDPASNWGNWQYIAGVGADPRGGRHFNLEKQTQMYDPDGSFRARWTDSDDNYKLDYVDAADWPIV